MRSAEISCLFLCVLEDEISTRLSRIGKLEILLGCTSLEGRPKERALLEIKLRLLQRERGSCGYVD